MLSLPPHLLVDSCKSLDQLSLTIPVAGHPVSPAHPLSGCPVPSVPPAAEPVPHLQTPNSEPQTMARECPQSSKPPSGSKSGLRNTASCLHVSDSKTVGGHSHPKQQRINRRRATNGWIPIGAASEKAVYVVVSSLPKLRVFSPIMRFAYDGACLLAPSIYSFRCQAKTFLFNQTFG